MAMLSGPVGCKHLKAIIKHSSMLQASWTAAMDSSRTQACLQWDTRAIGVACILIVFQKNKIDVSLPTTYAAAVTHRPRLHMASEFHARYMQRAMLDDRQGLYHLLCLFGSMAPCKQTQRMTQ